MGFAPMLDRASICSVTRIVPNSAAIALLNAIEQAGSTDYDAVTNALRTKDVETPLGKIRFDDRGDAIGVGFSMYQVKDGAYVELK